MEENKTIDSNVEVEGGATETEAENKDTKTEKTFTQAELDKIIEKRLARERKDLEAKIEAERREAEELAKLSEKEKQQRILEKRIKELEAREKEIAKRELETETDRQLKELGINTKATRFVLGADAESTHENIKEFTSFVEELKEDLKRELLKGKTPAAGLVNNNSNNPYVKGESWSLTKQMELEITNPTLARQLKEQAK